MGTWVRFVHLNAKPDGFLDTHCPGPQFATATGYIILHSAAFDWCGGAPEALIMFIRSWVKFIAKNTGALGTPGSGRLLPAMSALH